MRIIFKLKECDRGREMELVGECDG